MIVTGSIKKVRAAIVRAKKKGKVVGFVPTMGALHQGHLSLVRAAKKECDLVAVSIFVNSLQFGPKEDYKKYPRNLKIDEKLLKSQGVDLVFYPKANDMYGGEFSTFVEECELSRTMCGQSRLGHFKGVCTVVAKLFNILCPHRAYFGQKDYQQALIIKRMIADLNFPVKLKVFPIIRERDGLAMSSRNAYLSKTQRKDALLIYKALIEAKKMIKERERSINKITSRIKRIVSRGKSTKIDYIVLKDADTLEDLKRIKGKVLLALAVYVGKTRLIDNIVLNVK